MSVRSKSFALAGCGLSMMAAAVMAQGPGTTRVTPPRGSDAVVITGHLDVIERSDVAALRDGVIESIECRPGDEVAAGKHLAWLNRKTATLTKEKADVQAKNLGAIRKAEAQKEQASSELVRFERLTLRSPGAVSREQIEKATADLKFAMATLLDAQENQTVAAKELAIAEQIEAEHGITAPIAGIVTDVLKHPGEKVGSSEPVLRLVNLEKLRFRGFIPYEIAHRLKKGDVFQVRPTVDGADLDIERLTFPAKITFIDTKLQTVGKTNEVEVYAELNNPRDEQTKEYPLREGMKIEMTIPINREANAVGAR